MNWKSLRTFLPVSLAVGYACLASYTWPHGVVPIVSGYALPAVLIGSVVLLAGLLLLQSAMFLPIIFLAKKVNLLSPLLDEHGPRKERMIPSTVRAIKLGLVRLKRKSRRNDGGVSILKIYIRIVTYAVTLIFMIFYVAANNIVLVIVTAAAWIFFLANIHADYPTMLIIIWMIFVYLSFCLILKDKPTSHDLVQGTVGLAFFLVLVPMIEWSSDHSQRAYGPDNDVHLVPNTFVGRSLQLAGIGGGLSVTFTEDNSIAGSLIFFDGEKAWYLPCEHRTEVRVRVVRVMTMGRDNVQCSNVDGYPRAE